MAHKKEKKHNAQHGQGLEQPQVPGMPELTDDMKKRLDHIKVKIDKFKERVLSKFEEYVLGIALLPPSKDDDKKEKVNLLLLVDDSDSTKMSKEELKDKLTGVINTIATDVDHSLKPDVLLLTELWQNCYDAKYDLLEVIANSAPVYDKGMLSAIKLSEIHKSMVLKKFEKYIVSYVLAGSLVQGKATPESDIDVFVVIDDTDVKKMSRAELRDKLRAIIIGMGIDAGKMTGIENKINIQVYILTDFWENIKEANPIIFTFLRDGIPLYDRGIFMPWKQLLQMGRIKPSPEAIDMFMHTGDQMLERVKFKLREIGIEDFFWATITPSQAALMLYGLPPPTPKENPEVLREIFVKKEKLLEEKYVRIFENILKIRKEMEHGSKKDITGKEIDELYGATAEFLERMKKLFTEIEDLKEKENFGRIVDELMSAARGALLSEGVPDVSDRELSEQIKKQFVDKSILPAATHTDFVSVVGARKDFQSGKLSKPETNSAIKNARSLLRLFIEYVQRKRSIELERTKVRVKYSGKLAELILLGNTCYVIMNAEDPEKDVRKASVADNGALTNITNTSFDELEKAVSDAAGYSKNYINAAFFESLKGLFGNDIEIMLN